MNDAQRAQALALHRSTGATRGSSATARRAPGSRSALRGRRSSEGKRVNEEAVVAGALLHDIGRSQIQTVGHGYVGAGILEKEGVDPVVVEIVRRHVGAGISPEEAVALGFPPGDYIPRTLEQKIVCFADKMLDGDRARPFEEEVKRFVKKGHDVQRLKKLKADVAADLGRDPEKVVLGE